LKTTNKRASAGSLSRGTTLRALIVWAVRAGPATQQSGQVAGSGTSAQVSRPFEKTAHSPRPLNSFVRRGGCFEDGDGSGRAACLGNGRGCYVADPASAVKMAFNVGPRFNFPILASKSLSDKTVLCVALPALCTILNPQPQITMSRQATVQLDNAPATGGLVDSGSTVAANVRSAWQTDSIFIRFVADISWCLRASDAVSWLTNHNW
jgi:hypothetical protein